MHVVHAFPSTLLRTSLHTNTATPGAFTWISLLGHGACHLVPRAVVLLVGGAVLSFVIRLFYYPQLLTIKIFDKSYSSQRFLPFGHHEIDISSIPLRAFHQEIFYPSRPSTKASSSACVTIEILWECCRRGPLRSVRPSTDCLSRSVIAGPRT